MTDFKLECRDWEVRAFLDGRKTMLRKPAWYKTVPDIVLPRDRHFKPTTWQSVKPGDRLWVRETWSDPNDQIVIYRANWREDALTRGLDNVPATDDGIRWRPSTQMPRWASRLTLIVTETKRERVQEISDDDAEAEGAFQQGKIGDDPMHDPWTMTGEGWRWGTPSRAFQKYWRQLHDKRNFDSWANNPEVVVLTFTVHGQNIDRMERAA